MNKEQGKDIDLFQLEQNREKQGYVRTFEKNGIDYPIPELVGSSRIIAVDEYTAGAKEITFGFSSFAPGGSFHKPHAHPDCEEVMYILSGKGVGRYEGTEFLCVPGDIIFVPKGAEHGFYNPFEEKCDFLFIYTKGSLRSAGLTLASTGHSEVGGSIEDQQKAGTNRFDEQ